VSSPRLPPVARNRLDRLVAGGSLTSLLSVPAAAALAAVGFEPAGDVVGAIGASIRHLDLATCGYRGGQRNSSPPEVRFQGALWGQATKRSYGQQLTDAYSAALTRLRGEAAALGADGVVGIDLAVTTQRYNTAGVGTDLYEIVATGTAVRAGSAARPSRPFTTDLTGPDVAALLLAGWAPVTLHVAIQVGVRHDDRDTLAQANPPRSNRVNTEVVGYSDLAQRVKQGTRAKLLRSITAAGADGGLLSRLDLTTWHAPCLRPHNSDHIGRCVATGTSIARFGRTRIAVPSSLTVLPVREG
jgi:uncharacterized protein YbjQ (UPF0145 family)